MIKRKIYLVKFLVVLSWYARAQEVEKIHLSLEFLSIPVEQETEFLALEAKMEPVFKTLIENGDLLQRSVQKLVYPGRAQSGYNYVAINAFPSFAASEWTTIELLQNQNQTSPAFLEYMKVYHLVKREFTGEVWRDFLRVTRDENRSFLQHLEKDFFLFLQFLSVDPDNWDPYIELENKIWKPIHQANIDKGWLVYWSLFGYQFENREIDYDLFSVLVYPEFEFLKKNIYTHDTWTEVHGEDSGGMIFSQTFANRDEVHAEVWKVITILK